MLRCPCCNCLLPADRERLGARCPTCRGPLFEQPGGGRRDALKSQAVCFAHPVNAAIGVCERCGNALCGVCCTIWRGQPVCVACVERALSAGEPAWQNARAFFRQALIGLVLGLVAWILTGIGPLLNSLELRYVLVALAVLAAVLGLGSSLAALRARGVPFILALIGLILAVSQIGLTMGLFLFAL
jgi:hypothetical protein